MTLIVTSVPSIAPEHFERAVRGAADAAGAFSKGREVKGFNAPFEAFAGPLNLSLPKRDLRGRLAAASQKCRFHHITRIKRTISTSRN
jgi:hypothetical protein